MLASTDYPHDTRTNLRAASGCELRGTTSTSVASSRLVEPFQSISLGQLNAKADMLQRRDNKYVIRTSVLEQAVPMLARYFDILEIDGKREFTYDTCYFDDRQRTGYFDHHQGRRIRCKVRMRKYVDAGLCFVEIKLKHNRGMTIKERLQRPVDVHGRLDHEALNFIRTTYRDLYRREFAQNLQPAMEMHYQRLTLVAKDGGERMTVDVGMTFKSAEGICMVDDGLLLVEAKSHNANGIADKILRSLHQHPTNSCSKYCVAMAALNKVQKYNKFLVALRKLNVLPVTRNNMFALADTGQTVAARHDAWASGMTPVVG